MWIWFTASVEGRINLGLAPLPWFLITFNVMQSKEAVCNSFQVFSWLEIVVVCGSDLSLFKVTFGAHGENL